MKKTDIKVVITYLVMAVISICMFVWLFVLAPWDKNAELTNVPRRSSQVQTVSIDEASEDLTMPAVAATPTPFVQKTSNEANQGCIGDEGLVW